MGRLWSDLGPIKMPFFSQVYVSQKAKVRFYDQSFPLTHVWGQGGSFLSFVFDRTIVVTRTYCPRKVCEIESWSWQGWQMIICKRSVPSDDHLQEARSSEWSFARGQIIWKIICKTAGPSRWSFARGWILWMISCMRPGPPDDHLREAGPPRWLFERGRICVMIICKRPVPPDDYL